ncbi:MULTISPECIES: hypothetical protein [Megasphaera]|uniref:Uncharacterized protein n=1 Tax=Megasphaera vaginalis (ex Srinivasan et al. 2021) TaxID=1111454 RepID=U7UPZ4_9FIRM|nr:MULTISPECIES: hypothetical protein [Megasphaera]ERT60543.1 hypothetical protein HMPREF1250_0445 [Megasphaera vaginalis (ex Srinivasan et al. 2021)]
MGILRNLAKLSIQVWRRIDGIASTEYIWHIFMRTFLRHVLVYFDQLAEKKMDELMRMVCSS